MNVYYISGMGADFRAFSYISYPEGYQAHPIYWITPHEQESLPAYALRLADQIDKSQPFILVGLSLGGMMAVEIAKRYPPVCTILISSIPVASDLPPYFRLAAKWKAADKVSPSFLKAVVRFKHGLFMKPAAARQLMFDIIDASDDHFIKWSMNAVLQWDNDQVPQPLYHLHGTRDEVLPHQFTNPTHLIPKASHMMIMSNADQINTLLTTILSPTPVSPI